MDRALPNRIWDPAWAAGTPMTLNIPRWTKRCSPNHEPHDPAGRPFPFGYIEVKGDTGRSDGRAWQGQPNSRMVIEEVTGKIIVTSGQPIEDAIFAASGGLIGYAGEALRSDSSVSGRSGADLFYTKLPIRLYCDPSKLLQFNVSRFDIDGTWSGTLTAGRMPGLNS